jgi:hypothetical protein
VTGRCVLGSLRLSLRLQLMYKFGKRAFKFIFLGAPCVLQRVLPDLTRPPQRSAAMTTSYSAMLLTPVSSSAGPSEEAAVMVWLCGQHLHDKIRRSRGNSLELSTTRAQAHTSSRRLHQRHRRPPQHPRGTPATMGGALGCMCHCGSAADVDKAGSKAAQGEDANNKKAATKSQVAPDRTSAEVRPARTGVVGQDMHGWAAAAGRHA